MATLVYIIAGEPSGDILASRMMAALKKQQPDISFAGIGGETMKALGFESLFDISELSVMGFWEVAPRLRRILKRMEQVLADVEARQPQVVVTVDSWGFVRPLLKKLKKRKIEIPVVHYVAPQVWAWKKGRAAQASKVIDDMMILWPYEFPYFEPYGLPCHFVGHPVIETAAQITDDLVGFKLRHQIPDEATVLCVLPGSRHSEVKRLIPTFKKVVTQLYTHFPNLFLLIPTVDAISQEVQHAFSDLPVPHGVIIGQYERYQAFRACAFALAASGTVTLELTACGAPHLIAYRFSRFTNFIVKSLVTTRYANLINILANRYVIPEFVLNNCRDDLIYAKALELMSHPALAQAQVAEAKQYFAQLKPEGMMPSEKAAWVVLEKLSPKE